MVALVQGGQIEAARSRRHGAFADAAEVPRWRGRYPAYQSSRLVRPAGAYRIRRAPHSPKSQPRSVTTVNSAETKQLAECGGEPASNTPEAFCRIHPDQLALHADRCAKKASVRVNLVHIPGAGLRYSSGGIDGDGSHFALAQAPAGNDCECPAQAGAAYSDLQKAEYETSRGAGLFRERMAITRPRQKRADELKPKAEAEQKKFDAAKAKEAAARKIYATAVEAVDKTAHPAAKKNNLRRAAGRQIPV